MTDVGRYPLTIRAGRSWTFAATLTEDGQPLDLTGHSFVLTIKRRLGSTQLLRRTLTVTGPKISCALTPAQTSALPAGNWLYDIVMTRPTGEVRTLLEGPAAVKAGVGE